MPILARDRERFMALLQEAFPDPKTELNYRTPYELLVAVVLSAQATDKGVNIATAKLFALADTPEKMVALGIDGIKRCIQTLNLFNNKAKHVYALSEQLIAHHHSQVPGRFEDLVKLPGVGRKTANVVLNVIFGQPTIAVDTHIFRVCNRLGFAKGKTPDDVEAQLLKIMPQAYRLHAHHYLLLFGRYICKAQNPHCEKCPVIEFCKTKEKRAYLAKMKALEAS